MVQSQKQHEDTHNNTNETFQAAPYTLNSKGHVFTPELHLRNRRTPHQQNSKFLPISKVVWWQLPETYTNQHKLDKIYNDVAINTTQETQGFKDTQLSDVASQTSPPKGIQPQSSVAAPGKHTGNEPVPFLHCSNCCPTDVQYSDEHIMTTLNVESSIPTLTKTTPHNEQRLVKNEQNNELYRPLTSLGVLK